MNQTTVGVITISDRASEGLYDDLGGPAVKEAAIRYGWQVLAEAIVPDDIARIQGCDPIALGARLRPHSYHRRNGSRASGRDAGGDPSDYARRVARFRRSNARGIDETDPERNFVPLSWSHR